MSMYRNEKSSYLASFYNFEDLLDSKRNLKDTNLRLSRTIKSKLQNMNNHEVLIFEPFYYILKDIFPNSTFAKPLYDRINETNPNSYLRKLSEVIELGNSIRPDLKNDIVKYAQKNKYRKKENNKKAIKFAQKVYKHIGYKNKDEVNFLDFKPYVVDLVIDQLNLYRVKYMLRTDDVTTNNFNSKKYELFIMVYSKYLASIVSKEGESPALNDNIDTLILLYVHEGRKFMTCEKKWLKMIKDVGLHKKYILPYSTSYLNSLANCLQLMIFGNINSNKCN